MEKLSEIIKNNFDSLSESQKRVAKYIIELPEEVTFKTASQIGNKVDVSESTVIRLAHSLGLNGYTHLQEMMRNQMINSNSIVYKFQTSTESNLKKMDNIFANVLAKDIEIINNIMNTNKEEDLWKVVNTIIDAERVVVLGYRGSFGPSYWFWFMLNLMLGNVNFHPSTRDVAEEMINLSEKSVVVAVSFPRYTIETEKFTRHAKGNGAKIIAITDDQLSPVGRLSDVTLITEANTMSGMDALAPVSSLLNLIIAGISSKQKDSITKRLKLLDTEYKRQNLFVDF